MGTVTAQILIGSPHPNDGGIIPSHYLFLSENDRPSWSLVGANIFQENEKEFSSDEIEIRNSSRKSIVSKRDIQKNEIFVKEDICFKRPGFGFSPLDNNLVIGMRAKRLIHKDKVIKKEDIE